MHCNRQDSRQSRGQEAPFLLLVLCCETKSEETLGLPSVRARLRDEAWKRSKDGRTGRRECWGKAWAEAGARSRVGREGDLVAWRWERTVDKVRA